MSKSIDYHQGYIDCLIEIKKGSSLMPGIVKILNDEIEFHEKEIAKIMEEMYQAYKES